MSRRNLEIDVRGQSIDLDALDGGMFPVEAFQSNSTDTLKPELELVVPWRFKLNLEVYASNALALAGGLAIGDLYRTGDAVCIVH